MAKRPALAKSELEIVQVVWKLGEARVRDVVEVLKRRGPVDFWTVQTYLRRLKAKGYLRTRREGRTNIYSSAVRPKRVVSDVVADLVDRLFDGHALPLVQHLIEDRGLTDDDLAALQATLDELKKRKK
jgi:BlaI family penicillinase repressor